jgi:acetylglutamate kinase
MMPIGSRGVEIAALRHAVPYLALFRGRTFVVEQVAALHHLGIRVVLVHGGGPQASELARRLGLEVRQVGGRRVTDEATLASVVLALNGETNTRLLAACRAAHLPAVGLSGIDAGLVVATRRPPVRIESEIEGESGAVDFGHVGDIDRVAPDVLRDLAAAGYVPVVSPLAADAAGNVLNLNADGVAAALAGALGAEKLLVMVETAGLLEDPNDPSSLVSYTDLAGLERLRAQGRIVGGMLPKARAIADALRAGVPRAHLVSWRLPDALLLEVFSNEGAGTLVVPELAALSADEREGVAGR